MGHRELTECFARAGKRFSDMPEFIEEQAEWLRCDPPIRLYPNSQFGIGVFSYFMLADELEIETCRLAKEGLPGRRLHVQISGSGSLFRIRELGPGTEAGTKVRLYLSQGDHPRRFVLCSTTLRELLWIAEFRTEVNEEGQQFAWESGQLEHPELKRTDILNANHPDVWWSSRERALLADGLANKTALGSPIIVNLHHTHRPRLTIDRAQIVSFDHEWLTRVLDSGWEPLLRWPQLTFSWLWLLWTYHPQIAERIVSALWQANASLKIGSFELLDLFAPVLSISELTLSVRTIGWFPYDAYLLAQILRKDEKSFRKGSLKVPAPNWFLPYRLAFWEQQGIEVPSQIWDAVGEKPQQYTSCPAPEPEDSFLFSLKYKSPLILTSPAYVLSGPTICDWFQADEFTPLQIICTAARLHEPTSHLLERMRRFAPFGLREPQIDLEKLNGFTPDRDDLLTLSRYLDGEGVYSRDVSPDHLLQAALALGKSVGEIFDRLRRFAFLGVLLPAIDSVTAEHMRVTKEDLEPLQALQTSMRAFSGEKILAGDYSWWRDRTEPMQIAVTSANIRQPISSLLERLQRFIPFGLQLPEFDWTVLGMQNIAPSDVVLLSEDLDGQAPWLQGKVRGSHIIQAAFKLKQPVETVLARLRQFEPLGLILPEGDPETWQD